MPWTVGDPPPPAKNWTDDQKEKCVAAANSVLKEGGTEEEAIFACIHAAGKGVKQLKQEDEEDALYWELVYEAADDFQAIADQYANDPDGFYNAMHDRLTEHYYALAYLGNNGEDLDDELREDVAYLIGGALALLNGFKNTLSSGETSQVYNRWRASIYAGARQVYVRASTVRDVMIGLPYFPGVDCLGNGRCGCTLDVVDMGDHYSVEWLLGPTEHCSVCLAAAADSPYRIEKS